METTILVIDDDRAIRESLAAFLEDRDYRVVLADDGKTGLKACEAERPDLVLVDLSMPGTDGFQVLQQAGETIPHIPLIVVSGTGRISDTVRALHLGAWDYILKPIEDMSVVEHAVEKALERARLQRENRLYQNRLEDLVRARTMELERSNTQLRNLNIRLRKLVEATRGLSACFDIKQFGRRLLEEFSRNMAATGGSIYSVEEDGLYLLHTLDPGHAAERIPFPLPDESILNRILNESSPFLIDNVRESPYLPSGWHGYRDGSMLAFPLLDEAGHVTVLLMLHNKQTPPFVEQDREIGTILASYSCEVLRAIRNFNALRESEKRFRDLADSLPQAVCEIDLDGKLIYVNKNAFSMFHYAEEEFDMGHTVFDMIVPEDQPRARENMRKALVESIHHGNEYLARRANGTCFPVMVYTNPIIRDGDTTGLRAIVVDISERKAAEVERERLVRAIEHVSEAVVITDAQGTIEYANSAFARTTGYSPEEAIGQNPRILKSGKHEESFYRDLWKTISSGKTWEGRIVNKKKNGDLYTDETVISPVWDSKRKNIVQYVSIKRDITSELEIESQVRRSQKLEAIGTLASGIAHDFNNILSAILGYSEMALRAAEGNARLSNDIQQVLKAGNRAKDLVAQILTFSRRTEGERRPIRLQPILKEALKLIRALLPSTIELVTEHDPDCGPILADATQIHQVIMNLCTNAYHAMRKTGGTLTVRLQRREVTVGRSDGPGIPPTASYAVITVTDTGEGMSRETLDRLFEPYFTTKGPGEGTGLGMAIVHGIVVSHSGVITVSSEPGEGTSIELSFPICIEAQGDADLSSIVEKSTGTERILFVDDEEAITEVIRHGLGCMGFQVLSFSDSTAALDYFLQHPDEFDTVVTDLTMPRMTGVDLARRIHHIRPDIPIILCSGYGKTVYENQGRQVGICAFVEKPIHPNKLGWAIRRVLDAVGQEGIE